MKTKKSKHRILFELGISLLVLTFYGIYANFDSERWLFFDSNKYQKTNGQITSSSIGMNGTRGGWKFYIQYEYYIKDVRLVSERVHFGYQATDYRSYAQGYVDKYPVGKNVVVYYNPDNPKEAVLEPQVKWFGQLYIDIFGITLSVILLSLSAYYRWFAKNRLAYSET